MPDVTNQQFEVSWRSRGAGPARSPADPNYPDGMDCSVSRGAVNSCVCVLPYPASGVGTHLVACKICGFRTALTAAGRRDDPRSIELPCQLTRAAAVA